MNTAKLLITVHSFITTIFHGKVHVLQYITDLFSTCNGEKNNTRPLPVTNICQSVSGTYIHTTINSQMYSTHSIYKPRSLGYNFL